jgi:hypothetical protein
MAEGHNKKFMPTQALGNFKNKAKEPATAA